jgi:hypothetical protein
MRRRLPEIALVLAAASVLVSVALYSSIVGEGNKRRDQTCRLFEGSHLQDVRQLRQTYRYLAELRPAERGETINRFVLQNLPQLERQARTDAAPKFCDAPGVGLPGPDPVVPKRPRSLR